jgi:hypothetical protein
MKKHFVVFMSPGTFVVEKTTKEIDSWDTNKAIEMSKDIVERHGSKPYGFYFITRERKNDELDSKQVKESNMYYIGGKVKTLKEVKEENDPSNNILISNMECNGWDRVVTTYTPWKWTQPLNDSDIVLEM